MRHVRQTRAELKADVRRHITGNKLEVQASRYAGCVSCCACFDSKDVVEWYDQWISPETSNRVKRWTAICPKRAKRTVIGSGTGLLDDQAFLPYAQDILAGP